jgi:hypothetical protein
MLPAHLVVADMFCKSEPGYNAEKIGTILDPHQAAEALDAGQKAACIIGLDQIPLILEHIHHEQNSLRILLR